MSLKFVGDVFHDECGVFAIWNHPEAAKLTYLGLYALQHRGQESAGIVTLDEGEHRFHKGLGLVNEVFNETILQGLVGNAAVGHNRYSTTGGNVLGNAQPLTASLLGGPIALGHNGNFTNAESLRKELQSQGAIFQGTNDTEVLLHIIAQSKSNSLLSILQTQFQRIGGAYSLVILTKDQLIAARDPHGFRPLVMGRLKKNSGDYATVFASETCAFDLIGAEYVREVAPGEIISVDQNGEISSRIEYKPVEHAQCIFEHVYFARPDSVVFGRSVYESRKRAGALLAKENPTEADIVIPVPDSGVPSSIGYAQASGIPFELGIIRNHYIGRTFIEPEQEIRSFGVKIKLNPLPDILWGKRVIVIDDSLVRGTTSRKLIAMVKAAGAREVHLRIAAPPTVSPCYYGVDTPQKSQLIAGHQSVEEIRQYVGADSLKYLSHEGLLEAVRGEGRDFCMACFTGKYPTAVN